MKSTEARQSPATPLCGMKWIMISFTLLGIGMVYHLFSQETVDPGQDLQQPGLVIREIKTLGGLPYCVGARPNPTNELLLIELTHTEAREFQYVLYDMNGKVLEQEELTSKVSAIHMKSHPSGLYLLKIMKQDEEIKTFEIIKQ